MPQGRPARSWWWVRRVILLVPLILAFGLIGGLYAGLDSFLIHPVPVDNPEQVYRLELLWAKEGESDGLTYPSVNTFRESAAHLVQGVAVFADLNVKSLLGDREENLTIQVVSEDFFELLGVRAILGRLLERSDADREVVVLSSGFWRRYLGQDPHVLGKTVTLSGRPYTVVGVVQEDFQGLELAGAVDGWVPVRNLPSLATGFLAQLDLLHAETIHWLNAVVRSRPGVTETKVEEVLTGVARNTFSSGSRDVEQLRARLIPIAIAVFGPEARNEIEGFLSLFGGLAAILLLVAVFSTVIVRLGLDLGESKAFALRMVLGASRRHLLRTSLKESLLSGTLVAGLAVLVTFLGVDRLNDVREPGLPFLVHIALRAQPVFLVMLLLVVAGTALLILVPRMVVLRKLNIARTVAGQAGTPIRLGSTGQSLLLISQVIVTFSLLLGALLLSSSLAKVWRSELGFVSSGVVTMTLDLEDLRTDSRHLVERLSAHPQVSGIGLASHHPLTAINRKQSVFLAGVPEQDDSAMKVGVNFVTPSYFTTLGIRRLEGREFSDEDRLHSIPVAIVNETMARMIRICTSSGDSVMGCRFGFSESRADEFEVVAVVADTKIESPEEDFQPMIYLPFEQHAETARLLPVYLLARGDNSPEALLGLIRDQLQRSLPAVRVKRDGTLTSRLQSLFAVERLASGLLTTLGGVSVLILSFGMFVLWSSYVASKRRELGIRMAVGAGKAEVLALLVKKGLAILIPGLLLGGLFSGFALQPISSFLYEVDLLDIWSLAMAVLLILGVTSLAGVVPTLQALRTNPSEALRLP